MLTPSMLSIANRSGTILGKLIVSQWKLVALTAVCGYCLLTTYSAYCLEKAASEELDSRMRLVNDGVPVHSACGVAFHVCGKADEELLSQWETVQHSIVSLKKQAHGRDSHELREEDHAAAEEARQKIKELAAQPMLRAVDSSLWATVKTPEGLPVRRAEWVIEFLLADFERACQEGQSKRALENIKIILHVSEALQVSIFDADRSDEPQPHNLTLRTCLNRSLEKNQWDRDGLENLMTLVTDFSPVHTADFFCLAIRNKLLFTPCISPLIPFRLGGADRHEVPISQMLPTQRLELIRNLQGILAKGYLPRERKIEFARPWNGRTTDSDPLDPDWILGESEQGLLSLVRQSLELEVRWRDELQFIRTAIAIQLYEKAFKRFPETLHDLEQIGFDTDEFQKYDGTHFDYKATWTKTEICSQAIQLSDNMFKFSQPSNSFTWKTEFEKDGRVIHVANERLTGG